MPWRSGPIILPNFPAISLGDFSVLWGVLMTFGLLMLWPAHSNMEGGITPPWHSLLEIGPSLVITDNWNYSILSVIYISSAGHQLAPSSTVWIQMSTMLQSWIELWSLFLVLLSILYACITAYAEFVVKNEGTVRWLGGHRSLLLRLMTWVQFPGPIEWKGKARSGK